MKNFQTSIIITSNLKNSLINFEYLYPVPFYSIIIRNNTVWNFNIKKIDEIIGNISFESSRYFSNNILNGDHFIDPENNNFHLKPDSPYIDAGTNENILYTETDIEGNPRIANGTVDLGAYEFTTNRTYPADTNQNWIIESEEFTAYNAAWKNATNWASPPNQIPAEYVTRSGFLLKKGGRYKDVGLSKPLCWMPDN
jgi:hypothetical protein